MNHSLIFADRGTHLRMLLVSLASVLAFIVTFAGVQVTTDAGLITRPAQPATVMAGTPATVASQDVGRVIR